MWLSVPNVEWKSALPSGLGGWLEDQTRTAREQSLQLDCLSIVENLSGL